MQFIVFVPEMDRSLYEDKNGKEGSELLGMIQKLRKSGKLLEGGVLADDRGGFLLMEASSFAEQEATLNSIFDPSHYHVTSHPVLTLNSVGTLLTKMRKPAKAPSRVRIPLPC